MSSQPYRDRRGVLMERLQKGLILVRGLGADGVNANFRYLTGLDEPRGVLLLAPGGTRVATGRMYPGRDYVHGRIVQQILFLPNRDPLLASWGEDSSATVEGASAESLGVDVLYPLSQLDAVLGGALARAGSLYLVRGFAPTVSGADDPDTAFAATLDRRFLDLDVRDGSPAVHEMRRLKDAGEVECIARAGQVTARALEAAVAAMRPGVRECELEAKITGTYRSHGAGHAFDPIVAAGGNAMLLHYSSNRGEVRAGDLVLIDTGARLDGYNADVSRTYPVDGRFTERQREVYEAVLAAQLETIAACRPGTTLGDLHATSWDAIERAGFAEHYPHGLGHHLGLETHDVGDLYRKLAPGAVVTIEPGIYIRDEGIGVRIEDDVLITDGEPRVLTASIPKTVEEVERQLAELRA